MLQITLNMLHSYYLPFYKHHITMQIRNTIAFNIWIYIRKTMLLKNLKYSIDAGGGHNKILPMLLSLNIKFKIVPRILT